MNIPADMGPGTVEVRQVNDSRTPWAVVYGRASLSVPGQRWPGAAAHHRTKREATDARDAVLRYLATARG